MGLFSAIGNLIGGNKDRKQRERQYDQSMGLSREQFEESKRQNEQQVGFAQEQFEFQKNLAEHGIATRIKDAQNAGISPLAAMGMPTTGGAPINLSGGGSGPPGPSPAGGGAGFAEMGQSFGRAKEAVADMVKSKDQQDVIKESEKVTTAAKDAPSTTPGKHPGISDLQMGDNTFLRVKSERGAQMLEDDLPGNIEHYISRLKHAPPKSKLPKGKTRWLRSGLNEWDAVTEKEYRERTKVQRFFTTTPSQLKKLFKPSTRKSKALNHRLR